MGNSFIQGQEQKGLEYFIYQAKENLPSVKEIENLKRIGRLKYEIIIIQNIALQINVTSDVLITPYIINNGGRVVDIPANLSNNTYGYDTDITNGGLYSVHVTITKALFNKNW